MDQSFQNFIEAELPLRQIVIRGAFDPSVTGQHAAIGSYFIDRTSVPGAYKRFEKVGPNATDWVENTNYNNFNSLEYSIADFIDVEWFNGVLHRGSTVTLADGRIYMLANSDGSSHNHYLEINGRPVTAIYRDDLENYDTVDSYPLSSFNSCRYTIQVYDTFLDKLQFSEVSVLGDAEAGAATEYSILHTSVSPLVEYGAISTGGSIALTALSIFGSMDTKQFKAVRTNFFK